MLPYSTRRVSFQALGNAACGTCRRNSNQPRMHRDTHDARRFEAAHYECTGLERRGEWNRLLLGRRLNRTVEAEKIIVCTRSRVIGRIQFDASWHGKGIQVLAGSAFRGEQETLLLAAPGAQLQTDAGDWEVLWDGLAKR